jgi:branched-subunit amino acid ABC-type transport system permease component
MHTTVSASPSRGTAIGWVIFVSALIGCMAFCGSINVTIEFVAYRRLRRAPKLAPLITAVGMSFVLLFIGLLWNGSAAAARWRACCRRAPGPRRSPDRAQARLRILMTVPLLL